MTTNQTIDGVPRHWAEIEAAVRGAFEDGKKDYKGCMRERLRELRALLDAPAETEVVHEVQWNSINGPEGWKVVDAPTYHRCTGHLWDRRLTRKPAAQPQGEPVAEIVSKFGDPEAFGERELIALKDISKLPYGTKLYAERPAAIVMPGRKCERKLGQALMENYRSGWNACLDEIARLNTKSR